MQTSLTNLQYHTLLSLLISNCTFEEFKKTQNNVMQYLLSMSSVNKYKNTRKNYYGGVASNEGK